MRHTDRCSHLHVWSRWRTTSRAANASSQGSWPALPPVCISLLTIKNNIWRTENILHLTPKMSAILTVYHDSINNMIKNDKQKWSFPCRPLKISLSCDEHWKNTDEQRKPKSSSGGKEIITATKVSTIKSILATADDELWKFTWWNWSSAKQPLTQTKTNVFNCKSACQPLTSSNCH